MMDQEQKKKLNLNKIDIYLIVIGIFDAIIIISSIIYQWVMKTELPVGFWTFATAVCGGEVVAGVIIKQLDTKTERIKIESANELEMVKMGMIDDTQERGSHANLADK